MVSLSNTRGGGATGDEKEGTINSPTPFSNDETYKKTYAGRTNDRFLLDVFATNDPKIGKVPREPSFEHL